MPIITVRFAEGRTYEQKKVMAREITDVMVRHAGVTADRVYIYFHDMKKTDMANNGIMRAELEEMQKKAAEENA